MNDDYFERMPTKIVSTVNPQVIVKNVKDHPNMVMHFSLITMTYVFLSDVELPIRPFNPDAQIFRPIPDNADTISLLSDSINSLISLSPTSPSTTNLNSSSGSSSSGLGASTNLSSWTSPTENPLIPTVSSPTVGTPGGLSPSNAAFLNKTISTPVFSPQTFAQTKFGSLKSKHMGRRNQSK